MRFEISEYESVHKAAEKFLKSVERKANMLESYSLKQLIRILGWNSGTWLH